MDTFPWLSFGGYRKDKISGGSTVAGVLSSATTPLVCWQGDTSEHLLLSFAKVLFRGNLRQHEVTLENKADCIKTVLVCVIRIHIDEYKNRLSVTFALFWISSDICRLCFLANVLRYVRYMLSAVRLSVVCCLWRWCTLLRRLNFSAIFFTIR